MSYSLNKETNLLVDDLKKDKLGLSVSTGSLGSKIIDAGINSYGSVEGGRKIAEICLGGLGHVNIVQNLISIHHIKVFLFMLQILF